MGCWVIQVPGGWSPRWGGEVRAKLVVGREEYSRNFGRKELSLPKTGYVWYGEHLEDKETQREAGEQYPCLPKPKALKVFPCHLQLRQSVWISSLHNEISAFGKLF